MTPSPVSGSRPIPYQSLQLGQWVKLICGASYQDMPTIRRLVLLYALAGVDCVDVAADPAVVSAARQGLGDAMHLAEALGSHHLSSTPTSHYLIPGLPWLMVSLNDSEDPHFRKADFNPANCPPTCARPCESICPTEAIQFAGVNQGGVMPNLCYGCGRCIAVCPIQNIFAQSHQAKPEDFSPDALSQIDAVEIHTQVGHQNEFIALWQRLKPWRKHLKLISISCPDDPQVVAYLQALYAIIAPLDIPLIWQTDGRPMSGDLGKGTTHATIRLAQKILAAKLPGYVQLAGGTNHYTARKLKELGLVKPLSYGVSDHASEGSVLAGSNRHQAVAGIAYGSYARTLVMPMLEKLELKLGQWLEANPDHLSLVGSSESQGLSRANDSHPCAKTTFISTIDSTDDLMAAIAQARQLVGALKPESTP